MATIGAECSPHTYVTVAMPLPPSVQSWTSSDSHTMHIGTMIFIRPPYIGRCKQDNGLGRKRHDAPESYTDGIFKLQFKKRNPPGLPA